MALGTKLGVLASSGVSATPFSNTYSAVFDGVNDYIQSDAIYNGLDGGTKLSVSIWIKPIAGAPKLEYALHNPRSGTANQGQFGLIIYESNRIEFYVQAYNQQKVLGDITQITYGSWNHILVTVDLALSAGNEGKVYINGVDRTTSSAMGTLANFYNAADKLYIGEEGNGGYNPFNGNIDELAIWVGTTLTSGNASTIYNSGTPTDLSSFTTPPTNWWRMGDNDGGTGTTLTDAIGSADATLINGASYEEEVPS